MGEDPHVDMTRLRHALEWPDDCTDTVMVVGAGMLGGEVVRVLAESGVRRISIVDPDRVTASSTGNSVSFGAGDEGRLKVDCLRDFYATTFPSLDLTTWPSAFETVPYGSVRRCVLVLGCVDSIRSRMNISRICALAGVPYLDGGLSDWGAVISIFVPTYDKPCFWCTVSPAELRDEIARLSCSGPTEFGPPTLSLRTTAAIAGAMLGQEALKLHAGSTYSLQGGHQITYDVRSTTVMRSHWSRNPDCSAVHEPLSVVQVEAPFGPKRDVLRHVVTSLGMSPDATIRWPGAWAYCQQCDFERSPAQTRYDSPSGITVLCAENCDHEAYQPLPDVASVPFWHRTSAAALQHRRLGVTDMAARVHRDIELRFVGVGDER
jgi:molybdopterin/thiamine biosynthesis adenylyltransferase